MGDILGNFGSILGDKSGQDSKKDFINFDDYEISDPALDSGDALGATQNFMGGMMEGGHEFIPSAFENIGTLLTGEGQNVADNPWYKFGQSVRGGMQGKGALPELNQLYQQPDPNSSAAQIGRGLGQVGSSVEQGIMASPAVPVANAISQNAAENVRDAVGHGATLDETKRAQAVGGALGTLDLVTWHRLTKALDAVPGLGKKVKDVLITGGTNALEEVLQQGGQNLNASLTYDQERELTNGLAESATVGGEVGVIAHLIASSLGIKLPSIKGNNPINEPVYDAEVMSSAAGGNPGNLPTPIRRSVEKAVDAEWSTVEAAQLPEPIVDGIVVDGPLTTLRQNSPVVSGEILPKLQERYKDSPARLQYALDYIQKKSRADVGVNELPSDPTIALPEEAPSLAEPVQVSTEEAELETLHSMLKDPALAAEDKKVLQQRLDELQGNHTIERRLNDSQRRTVQELIDNKDIEGIAKLIYHDDLTGLMNKRSWDEAERLASMVGAHVGSLDLAGMKYVNDTFGHPAGDELFRLLGSELKDSGTLLFRKGGDEFAAVFEKGQDPNEVLSKLRKTVGKLKVKLTDEQGNTKTFSGWSLDYGTGEDFNTADAELYTRRKDAEATGRRNPNRGEQPYGLVEEQLQTGDENQLRKEEIVAQSDEPVTTPEVETVDQMKARVNSEADQFYQDTNEAIDRMKKLQDETADETLQRYLDIAEGNIETKPSDPIEPTTPISIKASEDFTKLGNAWIAKADNDQHLAIIKEGKTYKAYAGDIASIQDGTAEQIGSYTSLPKARKALAQPVESIPVEPITKVDLKDRMALLKAANEKAKEKKIQDVIDEGLFEKDDAAEFVSWEEQQEEGLFSDTYEDQYDVRGFDDIAKDLFTILGDERGAINPKDDPDIKAAKKRLNNDFQRLMKLAKRFTVQLFTYPNTVLDEKGEPRTVYHGSSRYFAQHSNEFLGDATGAPSAKLGHFFSGTPRTAESYTESDGLPNYRTTNELIVSVSERMQDPQEAPYVYQSLKVYDNQLVRIRSDIKRIMAKFNARQKGFDKNPITMEFMQQINSLSEQVQKAVRTHQPIKELFNNPFVEAAEKAPASNSFMKDFKETLQRLRSSADEINSLNEQFMTIYNKREADPHMVQEFNQYIRNAHKNWNRALYEKLETKFKLNDENLQYFKNLTKELTANFKKFGRNFVDSYMSEDYAKILKNDMWKVLDVLDYNTPDNESESYNAGIRRDVRKVLDAMPKNEADVLVKTIERMSKDLAEATSQYQQYDLDAHNTWTDFGPEQVDNYINNLEVSGPNIRPTHLVIEDPYIYDMKGEEYRDVTYYELIKKAWKAGHDGVIIKNTYDGSPYPDDIYIVKDADQIIPALEHEAEVIQGLWKRLGKHLNNERGSVDMRGAYGLVQEIAKRIRNFYNAIKAQTRKLHQWVQEGKRAAAEEKITDKQQQNDQGALQHYMKSVVHAYNTDLQGVAKDFVDAMKAQDRIVPVYKKGDETPPRRQIPMISKGTPGYKPGLERYSIGWIKRNFRTPSGMFRNIFPVEHNPSIDMAESQMAFINNTANDMKWYRDVVGGIDDNSIAVRKRLDVFYDDYNKLRQSADRESRKIQGWTEKLRQSNNENEKAMLRKKIKAANKRNRSRVAKLAEGLRVAFDTEFSKMCEEYSDIRITAQVLEQLPAHIKLTEKEQHTADLVRDYFERTKNDMIQVGLPVVNDRKYIHHIIPKILNDPDSQAFARRNNLPASLKFLHQSEDGRPWYPSIHDILKSYIPMVNKKLSHETFLQKWQPAISVMPESINRYMTDWVEENLFRKPYTPFERAVNHVVEFEYLRLTGMSLSVMFKHGTKGIDTLMRYDAMTNTRAMQSLVRATTKAIADKMGVQVPTNAEFDAMKAFVNMNTMLQMTTEFPIMDQSANILKRLAGAGVNMVEFLDNGVTVFAGMMASHNANMSMEQATRIIWDTALAANFRGGHDMPFAYRNPAVRPFMMFQSTVQKLWGYRGSIIKGAVNGTQDAYGTPHGVMLIRMLLMMGVAEGLMRDFFDSSLIDQILHTPYVSHLISAESGGYAMHEPRLSGSPVIDYAYNAAKKGIATATKDKFSYWGEMTKIANTLNGRFPKNYYRSPVMYHLGITKVGGGSNHRSSGGNSRRRRR